MGKSRSAVADLFAMDFQVHAAMVLMLENIKDLSSIRIESENEDIDIELCNGKHILAQAKAVVKSSSDFRNVRKNLKKALLTLSEANQKVSVEKLIFITNSPNPFNEEASRSIFWGPTHRSFITLPKSSQKIITDYLLELNKRLDTEKFVIQVIPFETDNDVERYKAVMQCINDFVEDLNLNTPGIGRKLREVWFENFFCNGTKKNLNITLSKNMLIWPIIVIVADVDRIDSAFRENFDSILYDEVIRKYKTLINSCCERVEFFTKILYDFNEYCGAHPMKEKSINFVKDCWQNYLVEFEGDGADAETIEALSKVVLYNVICRRYDIDKIKKGVAL